jgi:hypothetical protein
MLPAGPVGYGEWGIVDGWRRPKPEYWLTKKAYSPVRVRDSELPRPRPGAPWQIPVKNWFNHTNLVEVRIAWQAGSESGEIQGPNVTPGGEGTITLPARNWQDGETVNVKFLGPGGQIVDELTTTHSDRLKLSRDQKIPAPQVSEDSRTVTLQGKDFALAFDKATGLIAEGTFRGKKILEGGPYLNLGSVALPAWWLTSMRHSTTADAAVINLAGAYMDLTGGGSVLRTEFEIRIDGAGLITTEYLIHGQPKEMSEVGIAYTLSSAIDRLTWDRQALWSAYPPDHIGRPQGRAMRDPSGSAETYRRDPKRPWCEDTKDFFLYGPNDPGGRGSHDFRSLKENIWYASCILAGTELRLRAESEGAAAVRAEVLPSGQVWFNIDNLWGYPDLAWGNMTQPLTLQPGYKNRVRMRLTDTDES